MTQPTFFWYDFETTGTDVKRDRVLQFAGQRTTLDLQPVGDPVMHYCQPPTDSLPQPKAALITGITPQQAARDGLNEADFAAAVHAQLAQARTCGVGYNTLRFDDAMTRHLLYRNFYDPYAREWQNGNSRWDIIDLVRMCYALRPEGIEWPAREDGTPSFKLEHLATANHLNQQHAHDALSDVYATIDLAQLIKRKQPKLWAWYFKLRKKQRVFELLDIQNHTPCLHVSSRYPAAHACLSMIAPIARHPARSNEIIVINLDRDPSALIELDTDAIAERLFTPQKDLPEGVERVGLRTVRANQSPAIAPLNVLDRAGADRVGLDLDRCRRHHEQLLAAPPLADKLRAVYQSTQPGTPAANHLTDDPELSLYGQFLPDEDKPLLAQVRAASPETLAHETLTFKDHRYPTLLLRYRARNWPSSLSPAEAGQWLEWRRARLTEPTPMTNLTLSDYFATIHTLRQHADTTGAEQVILDQLEAWGLQLQREVSC